MKVFLWTICNSKNIKIRDVIDYICPNVLLDKQNVQQNYFEKKH